MKNKIFYLAFAILLTLSLAGCDNKNGSKVRSKSNNYYHEVCDELRYFAQTSHYQIYKDKKDDLYTKISHFKYRHEESQETITCDSNRNYNYNDYSGRINQAACQPGVDLHCSYTGGTLTYTGRGYYYGGGGGWRWGW